MKIQFVALPEHKIAHWRTCMQDDYDLPIERYRSRDNDNPCRCCLQPVPVGQDYLVLACRPFETMNPYTETGPIFLCAEKCAHAVPTDQLPAILSSPNYLLRGYSTDERIVYGTGQIVARDNIKPCAQNLFERPGIRFVDVRSASNNCFHCRIFRGG